MSPRGQITYRWARRIAVSVVGGSVLMLGVALLVLPGPALVVIPVGLAILGLEFAWARNWLRKVRERSGDVVAWVSNSANGLFRSNATGQARGEDATAERNNPSGPPAGRS